MTRFNNDALNGYVDADGFKGAASAADVAANRASTQPALFPYGATLSGSTSSGTDVIVPVTVVATGSSSQSGSRAVISGSTVVTTCSGSTRGIRLSGGIGSRWEVFDATAFAVLVYPVSRAHRMKEVSEVEQAGLRLYRPRHHRQRHEQYYLFHLLLLVILRHNRFKSPSHKSAGTSMLIDTLMLFRSFFMRPRW